MHISVSNSKITSSVIYLSTGLLQNIKLPNRTYKNKGTKLQKFFAIILYTAQQLFLDFFSCSIKFTNCSNLF